MPDSNSEFERLRHLIEYQALAEAALGAVELALSDPSRTKAEAAEMLALWRRKLAAHHAKRLAMLEAHTAPLELNAQQRGPLG